MSNTGIAEIKIENSSDWEPEIGTNSILFKDKVLKDHNLDPEAYETVSAESADVLRKCFNPNEDKKNNKTTLCVGKVQSGKTMSFTSLIALAADNKVPLIILLAGSKKNLFTQNHERIEDDLQIKHKNSSIEIIRYDEIKNYKKFIINSLLGRSKYSANRTIVISCLKQHSNISKISDLFKNYSQVRTLIISDEADEIELDSSRRNEESTTTFREIKKLKDTFYSHSYVQYTATPQGIILSEIASWVRPSEVTVLTPGEGYCGGSEFFCNNESNQYYDESSDKTFLIRDVNADQDDQAIPDSLEEAICVYLLGIADYVNKLDRGEEPNNRSMIIHPNTLQSAHSKWWSWVDDTFKVIRDSNDKILVDIFKEPYQILKETVPDLKELGTLLAEIKDLLLNKHTDESEVDICIVNAQAQNKKDWPTYWKRHKFCILVGANMLNRGFTIEGLTVTYMPRNPSPQDDTLQQRARFFGYKESYMKYCRLYLNIETQTHYINYYNGEEHLYKELKKAHYNEKKLSDILRKTNIPVSRPGATPTGRSKIKTEQEIYTVKGHTYYHDSRPIYEDEANYKIAEELIENYEKDLQIYDGNYSSRTEARVHRKCYISYDDLINFMEKYQFRHSSYVKFCALKSSIKKVDKGKVRICLFEMAYKFKRTRTMLYFSGGDLFQGKATLSEVYPGDRAIFDRDVSDSSTGEEIGYVINLQLHKLYLSKVDKYIYMPAIRLFEASVWSVPTA